MNCKCRPPCLLQAIWLNAEKRLVGLACNAASMPDLSAKARKDASLNGLDMGPGARLALRACKPQQCTNPSGAQLLRHPLSGNRYPRSTRDRTVCQICGEPNCRAPLRCLCPDRRCAVMISLSCCASIHCRCPCKLHMRLNHATLNAAQHNVTAS
jgi:hypothetical protein